MRATWILLAASACGSVSSDPSDDTATPGDTSPVAGTDPRADMVDCPGSEGCEPGEDLGLRVGVAVRSIIPDCFEEWTDNTDTPVGRWTYQSDLDTFADCGCDRLCPDDAGYPGPDEGEGDGLFHPIWMAGFQNNKPAMGVRGPEQGFLGQGDGLDARALVFDRAGTRVALVTLDSIGTMNDDVRAIREAVQAANVDVDWVIVSSSHSHSAIDMMGIYGRGLAETGYDGDYASQLQATAAQAVVDAVAALEPVTMRYAQVDTNSAFPNGSANLISDTRDPQIVDPRIGVVQFRDGADATVATLVHWANHPESIGGSNGLISSGFVHGLRKVVSEGITWSDGSSTDGVGGTTVYLQGTVGGMMTSLRAVVVDPAGNVYDEASWDKADAVGALVGELALKALDNATDVADPSLRVAAREVFVPVDNIGFQAMFTLGVLAHRSVHHYDESLTIGPDNRPDARTEVDLFDLGPVRMLTVPGELFPENAIGGFDGRWTPPGGVLVDPNNPNPPALEEAPPGPYLLDELGGELSWIVGLGNDEIGYIIPPYNFLLGAAPYLSEAEGDHYEETNSLGPDTWPILDEAARQLRDYVDGVPAAP